MIHPWEWSLFSIYERLFNNDHIAMHRPEREAYRPPFPLKGKVVLDLGGYVGDSAYYFRNLGALKVVVIEPYYIEEIERNIRKYWMWNVEVIEEKFRLSHLDIPHDFCKMDIEGYEEGILHLDPCSLKPTIIEVHGRQLTDRFIARGWTLQSQPPPVSSNAYVNNYRYHPISR